MSYEVGKFYTVPCVKAVAGHRYDRIWRGAWVPVTGPQHRDNGAVNFPYLHWHVDWRFVSDRIFKRSQGYNTVYATVLNVFPVWNPGFGEKRMEEDTTNPFTDGGVVYRRRKCMRQPPAYLPANRIPWLVKLQKECGDMRMTNMVCPHRGLPLKGCQQDGDVVQCPGHGLRWNVKTGELVTTDSSTISPATTNEPT